MEDVYRSKLDGTTETEEMSGEMPEAEVMPLSMEEAQTNALMTLAATAGELARAVSKISAYTPTQWVDNSEPSINATRLMHIENGIKNATNAVNAAIDAITANTSNIAAINGALNGGAVSGSIKTYANSCPIGISAFTTNSSTSDLPTGSGAWSTSYGLVVRRSYGDAGTANISVMLFDPQNNAVAVMSRKGTVWSGWAITATETEIAQTYLLEYDSDKYKLIPENTDLNTLVTPGVYYSSSYTNTQTFKNCPSKLIFKMIIERVAPNASLISQKIIAENGASPKQWYRVKTTEGEWSEWLEYATKGDLNVLSEATVSSKFSGTFRYSKIGHVVVAQGELISNQAIESGEVIVSGLPKPNNGTYAVNTTKGDNNAYINSTGIHLRTAISSGETLRLSVSYLTN